MNDSEQWQQHRAFGALDWASEKHFVIELKDDPEYLKRLASGEVELGSKGRHEASTVLKKSAMASALISVRPWAFPPPTWPPSFRAAHRIL